MGAPSFRMLLDCAEAASDLAEDLTVDLMHDREGRRRAKELLDLVDSIRKDLVVVAAVNVVADIARGPNP